MDYTEGSVSESAFAVTNNSTVLEPSTEFSVAINTQNSNPRGYRIYLPPGYNTRNDWPVLVYFHGTGETGSGSIADLASLANNGVMGYLNTNDEDFVVIAPQDFNGLWGDRAYTFWEWARTEYASKTNPNNWHNIYNSGGGVAFRTWIQDNPASLSLVASQGSRTRLSLSLQPQFQYRRVLKS